MLHFAAWHPLRSTQLPPCGTLPLPTASRENNQQELHNLDPSFSIATLPRVRGLSAHWLTNRCVEPVNDTWNALTTVSRRCRRHKGGKRQQSDRLVAPARPIPCMRLLRFFRAPCCPCWLSALLFCARIYRKLLHVITLYHVAVVVLVADLRTRPVQRRNGAGSAFRTQRSAMRNPL